MVVKDLRVLHGSGDEVVKQELSFLSVSVTAALAESQDETSWKNVSEAKKRPRPLKVVLSPVSRPRIMPGYDNSTSSQLKAPKGTPAEPIRRDCLFCFWPLGNKCVAVHDPLTVCVTRGQLSDWIHWATQTRWFQRHASDSLIPSAINCYTYVSPTLYLIQ